MSKTSYAAGVDFEEQVVYYPKKRPGYTAWANLFLFGNGDIGLAFDEVRQAPNPRHIPLSIEFLEASGIAYLYSRTFLPSAHPDLLHERVFMKSTDAGRSWKEIHREWGTVSECVGYPDGRLVRVPYNDSFHPERGLDRLYTSVAESLDGGRSFRQIARLPHIIAYRFKKLRDGSLVLLGPIMPTYGPGGSRFKRDEQLPGERYYEHAAFMFSPDGGYTWTGPHYVLQGIKAPEPDFVELSDGRLLIINCGVQMGASVRQFVHRTKTGFICDPVMDIQKGGADGYNVQSGIVPESIDITADGMIIGARRGSAYTCSNDLGETWYPIEGLPDCKYQPQVRCLPDGRFMTAWHLGTDAAFGQQDMCIGIHTFRLKANLPKETELTLERSLSDDGSQFINAFASRLTVGGNPLPGKTIELRVKLTWRPDGTYDPTPVGESADVRTAVTDEDGVARFALTEIDPLPDMHHSYDVQASFTPGPVEHLATCKSVSFSCCNKTSRRNTPYAYPLYFAECVLFLSAPTAEQFPELVDLVERFERFDVDATREEWDKAIGNISRAGEILEFLLANQALSLTEDGKYHWYRSVHCGPKIIEHVRVNDLPDYCL